ncbi:AMP-binding protein [Stappia sp. P2PMeth1]|uniref:AMP-binding protein n=1 Tax=Stappia sp. P2PMeth1 TaxID=2003586 RepID=UPI001648FF24|nr:AMP-binding protein [Stappia sp. P2PMeth1]
MSAQGHGSVEDLHSELAWDASVFSRFQATALAKGEAAFLKVLDEPAGGDRVAAGVVSYAVMLQRVEAWKAAFRQQGYGRGHRVGLLLKNRPDFLEAWFALNALGVSVVPINSYLRGSELEYIVAHSEMTAALVLPERSAEVVSASVASGRPIPVFSPGEQVPAPFDGPRDQGEGDAASECALLYTSGTTGRPKGCVLTNEYFLYSGDWYRDIGGTMALREGDRMLTPLPVYHMNAMAVSVMAMVTVGGCLILLDRFRPTTWWDHVRETRATCLHYLGVMPSMLMGAPASPRDRDHCVRFGFGAGVDKQLHGPFEERFGFPLVEAWAMTETGSGGAICANREPRKIGTSCFGRPSPDVEVRIVDEAGNDVECDLPGELLVRRAGPNPRFGFFRDYLKDPQATDEAWAGGWFHTGDVVSRDRDGDLHFVDRKKNVIRRSGENIAAVEVETVLNEHPLIRQSGVTATPDPVRGDEVAALIVLERPGLEPEDLVRWGLERMAYYKVPGWIAFVDALPLTATEKIQRAGLKAQVEELMAKGALQDMRHLKKQQL